MGSGSVSSTKNTPLYPQGLDKVIEGLFNIKQYINTIYCNLKKWPKKWNKTCRTQKKTGHCYLYKGRTLDLFALYCEILLLLKAELFFFSKPGMLFFKKMFLFLFFCCKDGTIKMTKGPHFNHKNGLRFILELVKKKKKISDQVTLMAPAVWFPSVPEWRQKEKITFLEEKIIKMIGTTHITAQTE